MSESIQQNDIVAQAEALERLSIKHIQDKNWAALEAMLDPFLDPSFDGQTSRLDSNHRTRWKHTRSTTYMSRDINVVGLKHCGLVIHCIRPSSGLEHAIPRLTSPHED